MKVWTSHFNSLQGVCCGSTLSLFKIYFPLCLGKVIQDNEFETKENKFKPTIRITYNIDMQPQVTEAPNMNRRHCCITFEKEINCFLNLKIWKSSKQKSAYQTWALYFVFLV